MDAMPLIRGMAVGRAALGLAAVIAPRRALAPWIGSEAERPSATAIGRAIGGRDLVLGAGMLRSLSDREALRPWLAAGVIADAVDCGATATTTGLPWVARVFVTAIAGASAAAGAVALASLDAQG